VPPLSARSEFTLSKNTIRSGCGFWWASNFPLGVFLCLVRYGAFLHWRLAVPVIVKAHSCASRVRRNWLACDSGGGQDVGFYLKAYFSLFICAGTDVGGALRFAHSIYLKRLAFRALVLVCFSLNEDCGNRSGNRFLLVRPNDQYQPPVFLSQ